MLDPRLEKDSVFITNLKSGELRMIKDGENEWFLIIPRGEGNTEIIDLSWEEQISLLHDVNTVSNLLKKHTKLDKINVASLGNMVSQLHVHIIARYKTDRAWPSAIWGTSSEVEFDATVVDVWKERLDNA